MESRMAENDEPVILIVDDEPQVRAILTESFADRPWRIEGAGSAAEALELCGRQTVDVLVLDKNLPDMSGVKLFWQLRNEGHPVACIMITGYGSAESAVEMLNLGVSAYFEKPFEDVFAIGARIEEILVDRGRRRQRVVRRARPRGEAAAPAPSQPVKPIVRPRLAIVAASDVPKTRDVLEESLSGEDLRLVASKRALEVEIVDPVDMVILDAGVATTSVGALVHTVRSRAGEAAIVVVAESPDLGMVKELIDLGVDVLIESSPLVSGTFRSATVGLLQHLRNERIARS
jgi:DNA-binding NtrC family response regulator